LAVQHFLQAHQALIHQRLQPVEHDQREIAITIMFGNRADIRKALRAGRNARREQIEQQAESVRSPMVEL
jgi:hypothetical protein